MSKNHELFIILYKMIERMIIKKKLVCNRFFYFFVAIYLDVHKFILTDHLNNYKFLNQIAIDFDKYRSNYLDYLNLFFKENNRVNQELIDCFLAYCGAILIDSNFLINCAKREIMGILEILIKDVITEENMKINPWFHYDLIVTENQIKEIGFK